jgi:hypothetical protein
MKLVYAVLLVLILNACDQINPSSEAAKLVKETTNRTKKYSDLKSKVQLAQTELQDFLTAETKICDAEDQRKKDPKGPKIQLYMTPQGDLPCGSPPQPPAPTPTPAPAAPAPAAAPAK